MTSTRFPAEDVFKALAALADLVEAGDALASLAGRRSFSGLAARYQARRYLALGELGAGTTSSSMAGNSNRAAIARAVLSSLGIEVPAELQGAEGERSRCQGRIMMGNGIMHVYGPEQWHDDPFIVGTEDALTALRDALTAAIEEGRGACLSSTNDGEGFAVVVLRLDANQVETLAVPYTDEIAIERNGDKRHPVFLLAEGEYADLLRQARGNGNSAESPEMMVVHEVEQAVGMGSGAWDQVPPEVALSSLPPGVRAGAAKKC